MDSDSDFQACDLSRERLSQMWKSHIDEFRRFGRLNDIEKAIEYGTHALGFTPQGHTRWPDLQADLGMSYGVRYQRLGNHTDLDRAIEHFSNALSLTPEGHPNLPDRHAGLGASYGVRYRSLGELTDLEKATEYISRAVALTPDGHPDLPGRYANLGVTHTDRYRRLGELNDLEKSIEYKSRAVALTPDDHPSLPHHHAALGESYRDRYQRLGELNDLKKAIEWDSSALMLTPEGHPDLPDWHAGLATSYGHRYKRLGELSDLEKSTKFFSHALEFTPDDHPYLADRHADLGVSYNDRYRHLGELIDLEKAIEYTSHALTLTPNGHPDLPDRCASLGASYTDRYQRLGELTDLESAIVYDLRALTLTPEGHPRLPDRHASLGVSHGDRYRRLGELADLEKSVEYKHRALLFTPEGHPDSPDRYAALGVAYIDRYKRLGELIDLENLVVCNTRALTLTPHGHPDLSDRHANTGASYIDRFWRLGELSDLQEAIEFFSRALELTSDGHAELPGRYANLGLSYSSRYRRLDELADLEKSIEYRSHALALTPKNHPHLSDRHADLGVSYTDRYQRLGEVSDLQKLIDSHFRALSLTPDGHPNLCLRHFNWALGCHSQYQHTHEVSQLDASLDSFRKASQLLNGTPRNVFNCALAWAKLASKHAYLKIIEAFRAAIEALPHFIWLGSTTAQRYEDILSAENLAVRAASAAILSSEYSLALEWLEHARCVVWNQSLMLRSPVDVLQSSHPGLATQIKSISQQLHYANSESPTTQSSIFHSAIDTAEHRHRLAREYTDLLVQARKLPGFGNFLMPPSSIDLAQAARNGPVVVINCEENNCDALLIIPGRANVTHIPLSNFTGTKAQRIRLEMENSSRSRRSSERGAERRPIQEEELGFENILSDLWYDIVKPVLDFLGYTKNTDETAKNVPHITWCPTGAVSFLPLHAAGDYNQPQSRVFDHVISSYTPTLTALLGSSLGTLNRDSRVLVVGQEATPGHQRLPGTVKELECVTGHLKGRVKHSELLGSQATTVAVLDAMEQHDWVHLACHAHQNVQNPTESGFFLHDGTLSLESINRRFFKNKGLAFLSACQTATGDEKLPDEAIHLASGMLMSGYSSVIATMWSVYDDDAPLVADKVYGWLMKDGKLGSGEAGKALHYAVAELRDKVGEKNFSQWVPYIHIGS
ncbi:hypothetical protein RhiTH_006690 [Rhizoctonia solani]